MTGPPRDPGVVAGPVPATEHPAAARARALTDAVDATLSALVAGQTDSSEAIHDFRVALRRLRSAQRPLGLVYGKGFSRRIAEALRGIADVTSDLRDEEVLRETLSALDFGGHDATVRTWMHGRMRRERGARGRVVEALKDGRPGLSRTLTELRTRLGEPPRRATTDHHFVGIALERALEKIEDRATDARVADAESMHRVRIAAKQLRYAAELVEGIGGARTARVTKLATRMQKHLGRLHDLDEALVRMGRAWGLDVAPREAVLVRLARERTELADRIRKGLDSDVAAIGAAVRAALDR